MKTINGIYLIILIVSITTGLFLIGTYYAQDFDKNINFVDSLNYGDIEIESYERGGTIYLQTANARIGTLELDNNGVFNGIYSFPQYIGCIDMKNNGIRQEDFSLKLKPQNKNNQIGAEREDKKIEVGIGEKRVFEVYANYRANVQLNEFSRDNIESISIYKKGNNAENPFDFDDYPYDREDCSSLSLNNEPEEIITVV